MSEQDHIEAEVLIFPGKHSEDAADDAWLWMPERLTGAMIESAGEAIDAYQRNGGQGFVGMVEAMYEAMKAEAPKPEDAA